MHDLKFIRETPKDFDAGMLRRGLSPQSGKLLELDAERRKVQTGLQEMLQRRNEASREVGEKKKKGEDAGPLVAEVQGLKEKIAAAEGEERDIGAKLTRLYDMIGTRS